MIPSSPMEECRHTNFPSKDTLVDMCDIGKIKTPQDLLTTLPAPQPSQTNLMFQPVFFFLLPHLFLGSDSESESQTSTPKKQINRTKVMIDTGSSTLKPSSRGRSRPSTPGVSFLHTTSSNGSTRYSPNTAEVVRTLTPDALNSPLTLPPPVRIRRPGREPEPASRSKTSLTLSLPEEETFGQPSIDLPGLNIGRDFGFGLGVGSRTSRIEERRSVVVTGEMREGGTESFENVYLNAHERQVVDVRSSLGLRGEDPELMKERRIAEMFDLREDDEEEEDKNHGFRGLLKKSWGNITGKCCCS
ncbi:hypothetical protein DSL72_003546 [Monilinia vaccinii-corymbosi]|uniref:Uncharacterized protein n=1 Tax=Monilinia vaccinii-corymbosi TaxID=61207 RepID=A0A8A3P1I5_9HELO|nr:hypothetical protein DSL72_003546 [Monilinia vaccinii-corymbosi]